MLKVISTGLQTTFQDMGRYGFRKLGVPLSGAMDKDLAKFANHLVGNPEDETVIEFTIIGPSFEVLDDIELAVVGIGFSLEQNNIPIPLNKKHFFKKGAILKTGRTFQSVRGYLAVKGSYQAEKILGSSSFYPLISPQLIIKKGSLIKLKNIQKKKLNPPDFQCDFDYYKTPEIEVYKGPEFDFLPNEVQEQIFSSEYIIESQSNRMAIFLANEKQFSAREIITSPVQPGTIQLTPSGKMIVLMRDAQTTGGYARVLQLSEKAINKLAQKPVGSPILFQLI